MNSVSKELAQKLERAEFPLPNPGDMAWLYPREKSHALHRIVGDKETWLYAPTITDLLPLLPGYMLRYMDSGAWVCGNMSTLAVSTADNPHDACAYAWLMKHAWGKLPQNIFKE